MSIRLRLVCWYGALFTLALVLSILLAYAVHAREHYDDRDRVLITTAEHAAAEAASMGGVPHLVSQSGGLEVALRLYNGDGTLRQSSPDVPDLPPVDPPALLHSPAGPAYDFLAGLVPPLIAPAPEAGTGAFGLFRARGERWRSYVLPLQSTGQLTGYLETLTPLGSLDEAIATFQFVLFTLGFTILIATLVGSAAIAGQALQPIANLIQTAETIATSRDFSHRVPVRAQRDELRRLAGTFNEMLDNLEQAYDTQRRFVADASHELRTPLTAIQANLELLERRPAMAAAERQEAVQEASRETRRLSRLVADLLTLARADSGTALRRQRVDLDQLLLELLGEARHLVHGQRLAVEAVEPSQVLGDPDRLKQLLLILLDNALKYTPSGGQITLSAVRHNGQAELTVRDNGVGIPAGDLPHVFDRFYRADPARARDPGGTGLGLPIARWIAEQHGGEVMLASAPQQGTTVTVYLPLAHTSNE